MSTKFIAFFFFLLALSSDRIGAATYYLDYTNGSNANDGLSPATAWKDLFKIRAANPAPGDTFLFKRGERWEGLQMYITASGTAAQPITYGAYGNSGGPLPVISSIDVLPTAGDPLSWTQVSTNIWTLAQSATPGRLFLDGVEHLRASTLADVGMADSQGAFGYWYYDNATSLLYLYATQNPATLYSEIKGSRLFISVLVFHASHMVFENLDLRGGSGVSLDLRGASDIEVRNCRLGHSGNSGLTLIDADVNGASVATSDILVQNNTFDSNFTFFYGLGSERGCGDGVKLFYGVNNCVVANNTFLNWAHNAVELLGNDANASGVNNNQIHDNHISAPDIPYAHPLGMDGLLGKCQGNTFFRNYIEDCRTASQANGNNNHLHHNIIVGMRRSPSKNQPTAHAFIMGIYGSGLVSENNRFDQNLIIDTDESAFLIRGYGFPGQVQGHEIRNNIIYETGQAPYNNAYDVGTGLVIYDTNLDGVGGNTYQNNLFYSSAANARAVYLQDNAAYYTASQFNALNGTDGNTIANNLAGDPLFTNLAGGNYLPGNTSPAVNAGIGVGLSVDYALNPRWVGPAPDIGPLETDVLTPLPVSWGRFWIEVSKNQQAILHWQTLAEQQASHFLVERSTNTRHWQTIGEVAARGESSALSSYRFIDRMPPAGLVYYRLKQVDQDSHWAYSRIVSCTIGKKRPFSLARLDPQTVLILSSEPVDWAQADVQLFDSSGRMMPAANKGPMLDLQGLPAGPYFLWVAQGKEGEILRFIR